MHHTASQLYSIWKILFIGSFKQNSEKEFIDLLVWPSIVFDIVLICFFEELQHFFFFFFFDKV